MAATDSTAPSPAVSGEAVEKAVKALLKWKDCQPNSDKPQLLSSDEFVYLVVTVKRIPPKSRTNPYKIPLIHPLFSPAGAGDGSELCLFLDDRPDRRPTSKDAKAKIAGQGIPISKVIKLSKLKTDYKPFEAKRKLCDSFDLFLADRRIIPLLPKHLGKHFFKKKKIPVAVDLEHQNWKEQVERLCTSALLHLKTGTCSTVRVARSTMSPADIVENIVAAINGVAETVPNKWNNLRSLHLKLSDSVALPIYQSLPAELNLKVNNGLMKEGALGEDGVSAVVAQGRKRGREKVAAVVSQRKKRGREEGEDVLSSKKKSPKASSKKGRIHQVRYMDDAIDKAAASENVGAKDTNDHVKVKKAMKKEASKVELLEAADGGKKKQVNEEASKAELVKLKAADGGNKKKVNKEASKAELVEAGGGGVKKKKVNKEASKDESVEADGGKKKKKVKKDELVKADGAKGKKKASKVEMAEAEKNEASKDKLVKADVVKTKKVKTVASKDEVVKSDGANLKKENKVRKVSNVAKSGSAKKSKRS